jgi:hypothetical protein
MDTSDVRIVFTPDQLERVGAFRYQVYIEEQGKTTVHADHVARRLIEPIDRDASSLIYFLERDNRLIATLRVEFLGADDYAHAPAFAVFDFMPPSQMMHFTRLMVAPEARRSDATPKLLFLGFALAVLKDRSLGLLTCKPELVPVFEMYGCLQYADAFVHPEHGSQVPMAILGEVDYLRARAAPLAGWLAQHRTENLYTERFLDRIAAYRAASRNAVGVRAARCLTA